MNDSSGIIKPSSEREWPKAPRKRVPIYTVRDRKIDINKPSPTLEEMRAHPDYQKDLDKFSVSLGKLSQAQFDKKYGK